MLEPTLLHAILGWLVLLAAAGAVLGCCYALLTYLMMRGRH